MHIHYVNKNRFQRMLMGIFLPVLIQVVLVFIYGAIESGFESMGNIAEFLKMVLFLTLYGYVVTGIQSIAFACVMEFVVNPRIKNHLLVVLCSSFLGALSGYSVMAILFNKGVSDSIEWFDRFIYGHHIATQLP